jgi:two-component system, LytTR family, response regulator
MITTVLIDDEKNALEVLEMQLGEFCKDVKIMACCNGGEKGIAAIKKYNPDLVFLDIEMPHKNGFDVLQETREQDYKVIFTTAYDQFAIKAFKFSAIDYLLKPIDILELQAAVDKARTRNNGGDMDSKINKLFEQLRQQPPPPARKIALPAGDAMQLVEPAEIVRCESDSNYTHIFLRTGKKITVAKTLKEIEETLDGLDFYRIHQSHLVNLQHINKVVKGEGGYVIMNDGSNIAISRNKKEAFLERFRRI